MKIVIQRVKQASVVVDGNVVGSIDKGFVLLVGIEQEDTMEDIKLAARKVLNMRVFDDTDGVMNISLLDINGEVLSISQFTLAADVRKGNRPSYSKAMGAESADRLYQAFNKELENSEIHVETGVFQIHMNVSLNNDGPVTIILQIKDGKVVS